MPTADRGQQQHALPLAAAEMAGLNDGAEAPRFRPVHPTRSECLSTPTPGPLGTSQFLGLFCSYSTPAMMPMMMMTSAPNMAIML
jgi:hypothetical protein